MSAIKIKLIETEDGSSSLYREDLNETYHSFHGAMGESKHVFIKYGLEPIAHTRMEGLIEVFEVGMGTGLNVFLTGQFTNQHHRKIRMTTLEPIPIGAELANQLNYGKSVEDEELLREIHASPWEEDVKLSDNFTLHKSQQKLEDVDPISDQFDVVYFDAFAPSKQPEMWSLNNLETCYRLLKPSGVLVTYCAQGQFKRNLKAVGFEVESLPGAMGKKEMVRAVKP